MVKFCNSSSVFRMWCCGVGQRRLFLSRLIILLVFVLFIFFIEFSLLLFIAFELRLFFFNSGLFFKLYLFLVSPLFSRNSFKYLSSLSSLSFTIIRLFCLLF